MNVSTRSGWLRDFTDIITVNATDNVCRRTYKLGDPNKVTVTVLDTQTSKPATDVKFDVFREKRPYKAEFVKQTDQNGQFTMMIKDAKP